MMPLYYRNIIVDNSRVGVDNARVGPEELIDIKKGFFKVPKKAAGKGSRPHPKRMNFRKSSKGPLTPPPHFRKVMLQIFSEIHDGSIVYNGKNLKYKFLD